MAIQKQACIRFAAMRLDHIPYILRIEAEAYPEPWTYNMMRQEMDNKSGYFCVMVRDDGLIGYGGFWMLMEEAHITRVTISRSQRGQGLSKCVMNHLLDEAAARGAQVVRLEVREGNWPAIRLYAGLGFVEEGRRIGYYQRTNENAICMAKPLNSRP